MKSTLFNTARPYSNVNDSIRLKEEMKEIMKKEYGITYTPCIAHNLTYFQNCYKPEQCSCYDFCRRFSSTDIVK